MENDKLKHLNQKPEKNFAQKIVEAADEMEMRKKAPSAKVLGFLCAMADGQFITNEKLQKIKCYANEMLELQKKNQLLEQENDTLRASNKELKAEQEVKDSARNLVKRSQQIDRSSIKGIIEYE